MRTDHLPTTTDVLIVGAGPVGAVLALELAHHGVPCVVVDRSVTASRHPKMDYLNGRSMELMHRLGLVEEIRARGVPPEYPFNFIWSRDFDEPPVAVWSYASVSELSRRIATTDDGSMPAQAHQRLQGSVLEEILRARLRRSEMAHFHEGHAVVALRQVADERLSVRLADAASGREHEIRARFVVGCDGANSIVRREAGIAVDEMGPPTQHRDVYFRSTDPVLRRHGRAFLTVAAGGLTLVSRDEADRWTGTVHLADESARTQDPVETMRRCLGADFRVDEVLNIAEWEGHLGVATRYREGCVFLAGDSAHQFYPTGGHGANTGIADAVDLGWKLAAYLRGWGGPRLLDSYEAERRPVALFNREMCANLLEVWLRFPRLVAHGASREQLAGFLDKETYQMDNLGIHFGYRYARSPVVAHEDGPAPPWEWGRIAPSAWPGGRCPAVQLVNGGQLHDQLGSDFTLIDLTGTHQGKELVAAAEAKGVPTTYLPIDDERAALALERPLVLVRPDQHVAWRGDDAPPDAEALLDLVTGH